MPDPTQDHYAQLAWTPADVQTLRPYWTIERCRRELEENENHIRSRLCELGWEVIGILVAAEQTFVIRSANEAALGDGEGFWSNESGWGNFAAATLFDEEERASFTLPVTTGQDACWTPLQEAEAQFGLHPQNPEYTGDALPDASDRREEATSTLLCRKLQDAGFVRLSNTDGWSPILEVNVGGIGSWAADDGEYHREVLLSEVAFAYEQRDGQIARVTMGQVWEAQPLGTDGFLLPDGNELWIHRRAIMAEFQPQASVDGGDAVMNIDGRCQVDVTRAVLACDLSYIQSLRDDQTETDQLVDLDSLKHSGPFYVAVEDAIKHFFEVEDVNDIDEDMLERERAVFNVDGSCRLQVTYPLSDPGKLGDLDTELTKLIGVEVGGAGTFLIGAPQRDVEFFFDSRVAAEAAAEKIRQFETERKLGIEVSITIA